MSRLCDGLHIEPLAAVVLHCAEADDRDGLSLLLDNLENLLGADGILSR